MNSRCPYGRVLAYLRTGELLPLDGVDKGMRCMEDTPVGLSQQVIEHRGIVLPLRATRRRSRLCALQHDAVLLAHQRQIFAGGTLRIHEHQLLHIAAHGAEAHQHGILSVGTAQGDGGQLVSHAVVV